MRAFVIFGLLAACARGPSAKLPDAPPTSLATIAPMLAPEHTTWNVFLGSVQVGRADLVVDDRTARSAFRTGVLASVIEPVRYELVTTLPARAVHETLIVSGRNTRHDIRLGNAPDGTPLHTLHSALAIVRAWAKRNARPGYVWLIHQGELFRLDVFSPARDEALNVRALRVDGVVRSRDGSLSFDISLWLSTSRDRTPLRFAVGSGTHRLSAEVTGSTGAFD